MVGNKIKMKIKVNKKNNLKETSVAAGVAAALSAGPQQNKCAVDGVEDRSLREK